MGLNFGGSKQKQTENTNQFSTQTFTPDAGFLNLLNPALANASGLMSRGYQSVTPDQIASFQNPYNQSVIDSTANTIRREGAIRGNDITSQAAARSAFGGSGWGLLQAENDRNVQDRIASETAGLNAQGFNSALAAAMAENQNRAQFDISSLGAYGSLLGLLNGWGTTTGNTTGTANRTGSGSSWGLGFKYGEGK